MCVGLRDIRFHHSDNPQLLVYSRGHAERDLLLCVVNLDPHEAQETTVRLDLGALGLPATGLPGPRRAQRGLRWEWTELGQLRAPRPRGGPGRPPLLTSPPTDPSAFAPFRLCASLGPCLTPSIRQMTAGTSGPSSTRCSSAGSSTPPTTAPATCGAHREARLPRVARSGLHLAAALLRLAAARRRLRHRRLLHRAPRVRRHRRCPRAHRGGAPTRASASSPTW